MQQTADDRLYYHAPLMHAALTLPSLLPLLVHNCSHTYRSLIRLLFIFHLKSCGNIDFMEKLIGVHFSVQKRSPAASAHQALFEIGHFPRGPSNEVWPYLQCHKRCLIPTRTSQPAIHCHLISFICISTIFVYAVNKYQIFWGRFFVSVTSTFKGRTLSLWILNNM